MTFTPRAPRNFNSKYDPDTDCAHLSWSPVEAGKCPVQYEIKYSNPYDSTTTDEVMKTSDLTYTKCGTKLGFNFTIRSIVNENTDNERTGLYSLPISKTGYLPLQLTSSEVFSWYYILVIVVF